VLECDEALLGEGDGNRFLPGLALPACPEMIIDKMACKSIYRYTHNFFDGKDSTVESTVTPEF
jgi:hypothetical protein